jgi:hypothetical protein
VAFHKALDVLKYEPVDFQCMHMQDKVLKSIAILVALTLFLQPSDIKTFYAYKRQIYNSVCFKLCVLR